MKKLISTLIVLVFVFAFASPAFAEPVRPVVFTTEAELTAANQIIVTISVSENGAFTSGALKLKYDDEILQYATYIECDFDYGVFGVNGNYNSSVMFAFANIVEFNEGGEFIKFVFDFVDPMFIGIIDFELEVRELIEKDTITLIETEAAGCSIEVNEHPEPSEAPITPFPPTPEPTYVPIPTTPSVEVSPSPDDDGNSTHIPEYDPNPPQTGGITLAFAAVVSAAAGIGALTLRKKV
jgi:hypothetical protein